QTRLPVVQRPATPEEQSRGRIVAVETRREHAHFLGVPRACEPAAQRPLRAERAHFFPEPRVDRRIRIGERTFPAVRAVLERQRRIERAEPYLLLVR